MITDELFKEMQTADPEKRKRFIDRFMEYIGNSPYKENY